MNQLTLHVTSDNQLRATITLEGKEESLTTEDFLEMVVGLCRHDLVNELLNDGQEAEFIDGCLHSMGAHLLTAMYTGENAGKHEHVTKLFYDLLKRTNDIIGRVLEDADKPTEH